MVRGGGRAVGACVVVACVGACGAAGARYVLASPISERCTGAGLKACPKITDGILLVVEGDKEAGTAKLREGVAENEPDDFRDFVAAMKLLGKVPGAGAYVGPINQVLATVSPPEGAKTG